MNLSQAQDFRDESNVLFNLLESLSETDFDRPTLFKGWKINDILGHLHYGNILADLSLNDEENFHNTYGEMRSLRAIGMDTPEATETMLKHLKGKPLLVAWQNFYGPMSKRFEVANPKKRVKWVGPDMSVRSSITARLMETWSHGQAAFDLLGVERNDTDRVKNIAVLGINTFKWTFINRDEKVPELLPHVSLKAPSGDHWEWNDFTNMESIKGTAVEFCQVVTQTRNVRDTSLIVNGTIANRWMQVAQCFAGPARTPPPPGTRKINKS